jgi:hypothetical protein
MHENNFPTVDPVFDEEISNVYVSRLFPSGRSAIRFQLNGTLIVLVEHVRA